MRRPPKTQDVLRDLVRHAGGKQVELVELLSPYLPTVSQPQVSRWLSGQEPRGDAQLAILNLAEERGLLKRPAAKDAKVKPLFKRIPLVNWVSAGKFSEPGAEIPGSYPMIDVAGLGSGDFFATKVDGNSMDRISPEHATVIVNRADKDLLPGKPYIFLRDGKATYKLWYSGPPRLEPFSTDPTNKAIYLSDREQEELIVVGRVRRSILDL
jgi:SOS-response transcriptional repressor LexA